MQKIFSENIFFSGKKNIFYIENILKKYFFCISIKN